jgi:hypothetical protein
VAAENDAAWRRHARVLGDLLVHEEVQRVGQTVHEVGAGRDAVGVEHGAASGTSAARDVRARARRHLFRFARRLEATRALLIHFGTRRHAVDRHEKHLARRNDVKQTVDVVENVDENLLFGNRILQRIFVGMRTSVNNAIHVEVQVVYTGKKKRKRRCVRHLKTKRKCFFFFFLKIKNKNLVYTEYRRR